MPRTLIAALAAMLLAQGAGAQAPLESWTTEFGRGHPLAGRIWWAPDGAFIAPEALADRAAEADYVLLGEKHDNADHHRLQAWMLGALAERGRRPAVAFEMLGPEQLPALQAHLAAHPRDAAGLGPAVGWEERWPGWQLYRPVVEAALAAGLPVVAADAAHARKRTVARKGLDALPAAQRRRLGLDRPLSQALAADLRTTLAASHCDRLPEAALGPMAGMQRLRDAAMAESLIAAAEGLAGADGAVLITGGGHARLDRGVPWYLRARRPNAAVLALAVLEVAPGEADPAVYLPASPAAAPPFDALWFTPRVDNEDPCETFADELERAGESKGAAE